jgi:hypothetical protein
MQMQPCGPGELMTLDEWLAGRPWAEDMRIARITELLAHWALDCCIENRFFSFLRMLALS